MQTLADAVPATIAAVQEDKLTHSSSSILPELAILQAEIGDLDGMRASFARIDKNHLSYVVQRVAQGRAATGDTQGALSWAAIQVSPREKALALVGVAEGILSRLVPEKK